MPPFRLAKPPAVIVEFVAIAPLVALILPTPAPIVKLLAKVTRPFRFVCPENVLVPGAVIFPKKVEPVTVPVVVILPVTPNIPPVGLNVNALEPVINPALPVTGISLTFKVSI